MVRKSAILFVLAAVLAAALVGCGGGTNPAKETSKDPAAKDAAAAKDAGKAANDLPGLKELNDADRKLAEQQKVCPVSGNPIGTAGMTPYKMTLKGRTFFLCCDGCKDDVDKDPEGILKKVDALLAKKK